MAYTLNAASERKISEKLLPARLGPLILWYEVGLPGYPICFRVPTRVCRLGKGYLPEYPLGIYPGYPLGNTDLSQDEEDEM
jgi:hypothetical protein